MDTLSRLMQQEIQRAVDANTPHAPYGVWIDGAGWLRNEQGRVFADLHLPVAETAARLWGRGAHVLPIDLPDASGVSALQVLERQFLEQQRTRHWRTRLARWLEPLWRKLTAWHTSTR